jgi:cytochrome c oxidase subunit 2
MFAVLDPVLSPVSPQAESLSQLFVVTLFVCAVIFVVVTALVILCVLKYRGRKGDADPKQAADNLKLEISWTAASILILVVLFALTVRAMNISDPAPDRPPDMTIIGHQWWWEARYPDGAAAANEIHIPVQSNILVRLESPDVIHDFWVPQLGRKMDIIPGHPNFIWIRADKPGEYLGTCAEYCGAEHAWMRIQVEAQSPLEYQQWLGQQSRAAPAPASDDEKQGLRFFREKTCINCHMIKGVNADISVAPDLTHFAGRSTIGTGVLLNNSANVRLWLSNPQAVKPACNMPNFVLSESEVAALTAYLETMK